MAKITFIGFESVPAAQAFIAGIHFVNDSAIQLAEPPIISFDPPIVELYDVDLHRDAIIDYHRYVGQ
jgi:hypothetical protein